MAIVKSADQFKYSGKGPLDAKSLVKAYADLLDTATWTLDNKNIAYNGMITAVWLNKDDTSKNGVYFLHDPACTSALKTPDVTNEDNWHRLGGIDNLPGLADQIASIQTELEKLQSDVDELQDTATVVVETKLQLPSTGVSGKIYVVTEEATTYVWYNNDYLPVGDGGDNHEIQIIVGGSPTNE